MAASAIQRAPFFFLPETLNGLVQRAMFFVVARGSQGGINDAKPFRRNKTDKIQIQAKLNCMDKHLQAKLN
jgi:hypothetical protein